MTTRHIKSYSVNSSNSNLTSSNGSKVDTPEFFYKDNMRINWTINDATKTAVNMTGYTFTLKLAGSYNGTPLLTVSNSSFGAINLSAGTMYCLVDLDQADILAYITGVASKTAYCSLWATKGGIDYLLAGFSLTLKNIIF